MSRTSVEPVTCTAELMSRNPTDLSVWMLGPKFLQGRTVHLFYGISVVDGSKKANQHETR